MEHSIINSENKPDHEKSGLAKISKEFKFQLFSVLNLLLKEDEISVYFSAIFAIIEVVQALIFPFNSQINSIWNSDKITSFISQFVGYICFVPKISWNVHIIIFYVLFTLLLSLILALFYLSYTYSNKRMHFSGSFYIFKLLMNFFSTVLYLPMLNIFILALDCTVDSQNIQRNTYFNEIICWEQTHILHATMGILISIVFTIFVIVLSLTYFETKTLTNDPNAKTSGRGAFIFVIFRFVLSYSFVLMKGSQFEYVLITLILVGSMILFFKFHNNFEFNNEIIGTLWCVLMSLYTWTALLLFFAKFMENTLFQGSLISWAIGLPFIMMIILTNQDPRIKSLLVNELKMTDGSELLSQLKFLTKLVVSHTTNRNDSILLDGYIEIHRQSCNLDDCPLKSKFIKNIGISKLFQTNDEFLNEKFAVIFQLIYKMYFTGVKRFPDNTALRMSYVFFLMERMKYKQQALQELLSAEKNKPAFDIQFVIYRYKRIIEEDIAESQNENGALDVVSELTLKNYFKSMESNIEKMAMLHMEFWSQLSEDNPDLAKLHELGTKITSVERFLEEHWKKMQKICSNIPKALRSYGKFLIEIMNDKERGEDFLERARIAQNNEKGKKNLNFLSGNLKNDFSNDSTPTIVITTDQDKFGYVIALNIAAATLFGYNKTEVLNRKINVLMPSIFSKYHDGFLEGFLATHNQEMKLITKDKILFGKSRSNYIFPFYLSIKTIQSMMQGVQFLGTIKVEKAIKTSCYIIADNDGSIEGISSSCITILKIDNKYINQKKITIDDLFPNISKEKEIYTTKIGSVSVYTCPKDPDLNENNEISYRINITRSELSFSKHGQVGQILKIEKLLEKPSVPNLMVEKKAALSHFQFKFDPYRLIYSGEITDMAISELPSQRIDASNLDEIIVSHLSNIDRTDMVSDLKSIKSQTKLLKPSEEAEILMEKPEKSYTKGIRVLRLFNNKISDVEEFKIEEQEEAEELETENKQGGLFLQNNSQDDGESEEWDLDNTFKSRKALNQLINNQTVPNVIRNLKYGANFLLIILIAIAFSDYFVTYSQFNDIINNVNLIKLANLRVADLHYLVSNVRDLTLLNQGFTFNDTFLKEVSLRNSLGDILIEVQDIHTKLQLSHLEISSGQNLLNTQNVIKMYFSPDTFQLFDLNDATQQIISKTLNIKNKNLSELNNNQSDVFFVTCNLFNDYYANLKLACNYYVLSLQDRTTVKKFIFMIFLIVSAVSLALALLILVPVLMNVNKAKENVLSLFLDIPEKTVRILFTKCETFISNFQVGDDDDILSEIEDCFAATKEDKEKKEEFGIKKKRKKFKNSGKGQRKFFIIMIFGGMVLEAYFAYSYVSSTQFMNNLNILIPEINATSVAESFFSFVNNAERELLINPSFQILNQSSLAISLSNIIEVYNLDSSIHQEHLVNVLILNSIYVNAFNNIMMLDPCSILFNLKVVSKDECDSFADSSVAQGMSVALTRHFENMRVILSTFQKYSTDANLKFEENIYIPFQQIFFENQKDNYVNIFSMAQANETEIMQRIYIKNTMRYLNDKFYEAIKDDFNNVMTQKLALFICFNLIIFIIYFILWLPLIERIVKDILRTRSLLMMIPLNAASKMKNLRFFLRAIVSNKS